MGIITLTSDFGLKDASLSVLKAKLISEFKGVQIVDISHLVSSYDISEAAYILGSAYSHFPEKTVHILSVGSLQSQDTKGVVLEKNGHYFIAPNNGVLSLIDSEVQPKNIHFIDFERFNLNSNFPSLDYYAPVALHILRGGNLDIIGSKSEDYHQLTEAKPQIKEKSISGNIIYIDHFGNVVSNIKKKTFTQTIGKETFEIAFRNFKIDKIFDKYSDIHQKFNSPTEASGEIGAIFNQNDFLEIFIFNGSPFSGGGASELLGLKKGTEITINF